MSKIVRDYVNASFKLRDAWFECFGTSLPRGKCYCPFHDNTDSPAAKVYTDRLVCFGACQRSFTSYDLLSRFRPDLLRSCSSVVLPVCDVDLTPQPLCRYGRGLSVGELLFKVVGL